MYARKVLLIAAVALLGTVGVASANGHPCTDSKGKPHFCWQPDVDPTFSIVTETATARVEVNHIVTVQAECDGTESYAVGRRLYGDAEEFQGRLRYEGQSAE